MPQDRFHLRKWMAAGGPAEVIVIGASTGGPDALTELLRVMPADSPLSDHRPSVDYLFNSAAKYLSGVRIFAVLLTGMGRDGAQGLKNLLDHGAFTAVQDQDSCVVYGMPKEAVRLGAAVLVGPVQEIRGWLEYASGITKVLKKVS